MGKVQTESFKIPEMHQFDADETGDNIFVYPLHDSVGSVGISEGGDKPMIVVRAKDLIAAVKLVLEAVKREGVE